MCQPSPPGAARGILTAWFLLLLLGSFIWQPGHARGQVSEPTDGSGSSLTFSGSLSGLGTTETLTREIAGVPVTFPKDEADTIELLAPAIAHWFERRDLAANTAADIVLGMVNEADNQDQVRMLVRTLLGGDPLSPGAQEAMKEAVEDLTSLADQWRRGVGRPSVVRLSNHAMMAPHASDGAVSFDQLTYTVGGDGSVSIGVDFPFISRGIGQASFDPQADGVVGMQLDLPIFAPSGSDAASVAGELAKILSGLGDILNDNVALLGTTASHYQLDTLLIHEIEARFLAEPAPRVISVALARIYLVALFISQNPDDPQKLSDLLSRLFSLEMPPDLAEAEQLVEQLRDLDPLAEVPDDLEPVASRLLALALFQIAQGDPRDQAVLQLFQSEGIEVPEGGFDRAGFRAALEQAYDDWPGQLAATRGEVVARAEHGLAELRRKGSPADADTPQIEWPEHYESLDFDGLTFHFPPAAREAVERVGPDWAADLARAREVIHQRFGGPWREGVMLTEEDLAALARHGLEPSPAEAAGWALSIAQINNIDKWLVHVFTGREVGVWYREDLHAALGGSGEFGGVHFDLDQGVASFGFPTLRLSEDASVPTVADLADLYEQQVPMVFPVFLRREEFEGKPLVEQITAVEQGDVLLRQLCNAADEIDPSDLTGEEVNVLNDEQTFFLLVHEVFEAALVRQVIASQDRRWFCDGLANLVAILECDRRFGDGKGLEIYASIHDPERSRARAAEVDLLAWSAAEAADTGLARVEGLEAAHYYHATLALQKAIEGRGDDFLPRWLEAIQETSWNRTNSQTVMAAYERLTGESLEPLIKSVTE